MDLIIEQIKQKINSIRDERESLENKYYADKRVLEKEYEITTALLLNQKLYLEKLLKEIYNTLVEKSDNEINP